MYNLKCGRPYYRITTTKKSKRDRLRQPLDQA